MSVATSARNVGAAAEPLPGPARIKLAFWFANVTASVPLVVIGEPATDRKLGTLSATLVTEPLPLPAAVIAACTNAVVATFVELSLAGETVGAVGVPVKVGEASGALADKAVFKSVWLASVPVMLPHAAAPPPPPPIGA
jgi:hypothetical protein